MCCRLEHPRRHGEMIIGLVLNIWPLFILIFNSATTAASHSTLVVQDAWQAVHNCFVFFMALTTFDQKIQLRTNQSSPKGDVDVYCNVAVIVWWVSLVDLKGELSSAVWVLRGFSAISGQNVNGRWSHYVTLLPRGCVYSPAEWSSPTLVCSDTIII